MMEVIVANWVLFVVFGALTFALGIFAHKFLTQPTEKQLKIVKSWLRTAVVLAEKEIGEGKGKQKLHFVYNAFTARYKWIAMILSFDQFSALVDEALIKTKEVLEDIKEEKEIL